PDAALSEWKKRLLMECDYTHERRCQEAAAAILAGDPRFSVPKVHADLSCDSILTQQLVQGTSIFDVMRDGTESERDLAGELITRSVFRLLRKGLFNFDIHPGNYLLDGDVLHCLDFGGSVFTAGYAH